MSYCQVASSNPLHREHHDREHGFPIREDALLFERLCLEINQAGLSWLTILKKKQAIHQAFEGFELDRVAAYGEIDKARLLADAGIIRNRLKVQAIIENARRLQGIRDQYGSFAHWLDHHHPLSKTEWQKVFKQTFIFTGGEIVGEFLMGTGYLPGAHETSCPIYAQILHLNPPWLQVENSKTPIVGD